jgi:hypothetical protein
VADKKFELGNYIEVKDRIAIFYELYPNGRLVTGDVRFATADVPDGKARVMVQALAYRTPDDPLPGVGWSWMELPGTTPYTRGSELENTETSAWGRAIASLGILIDKSIASAQEVQNKEVQPTTVTVTPAADINGGLIGIAEVGKAGSGADFDLRQGPDGDVAAFRLKQGRTGFKVIAHGPLAVSLATLKPEGQQVQVWGRMQPESFTPEGSTKAVTYNVVIAERIEGPDWKLPVTEATPEPIWPDITPEEAAEIEAHEKAEATA